MTPAIHLLYAEDNPQDADQTRAYFELQASDITLEIVTTGARCLARLAEQAFDLLLLDNRLPDMDGLDVLARLRAGGHHLPVVVVTGTGDEEVVVRMLRAGAADYVSKSDRNYLATLPNILRRQVARHRQHLVDGEGRQRVWQILYIEPNQMDVELTARHIAAQAAHLQLRTVTRSHDALALLTPGHPFDLVLTDFRVPDMNALELIHEAQHRGLDIPFIIITGKGDETSAVAALRLGAYDYILKRDNYLSHLPHAIDNALHRFQLDQKTLRLTAELTTLNATLEQQVEARTAQLRQEMELRHASEQSYQHLIATTHDLVQNVGADGKFIFVNHAWCATLGWSKEEALQLGFSQVVKPDQLAHCQRLFAEMQQGKNFSQIEVTFIAKDGHEIMLEGNLSSIVLDGVFVGTQSFFRDVTRRKQAERELHESAQRLRIMIETEPECVKVVDPQGRLVEMNAAGLAMLEAASLNEVQQRSLLDYILPAYQWPFRDLQRRVMLGESGILEFEVVGLKGTHRWLETHAAPMRDAAGKVMGLLGITRDITERKQTEAHLKLAAKVFEQSNEAFLITDAQRNIIMINHAFTAITGYSEAEALGKNPRLLYSGRQDGDFYSSMWESINTQGHWQGEMLDRRKDGSTYPKWLTISRVLDEQGKVTHYIGIFSDISKHKRDEAHIQRLAHFDALTELPNRALLNDRIDIALSFVQRNLTSLAVMFVDLDHFKNVNDTLGHRIGDALLIEVAKRLKSVIREEDTVSRLGGDEFIFVLPGTDAAGAAHVAEKLLNVVAQRYQIEQHELIITPSIGIAIYPNDGEDFESLSQCADIAMYRAKRDGRNNYRFFTAEMQARSARTLQLENALRVALERNQMELHYQPQIALSDNRIIGAEALLRWRHPEFGMVSPAEFIPIAEDSGQILRIGEWVLRTAIRQLKTWMDAGMAPITMAVNLSVVQFRHLNLPEMVTHILDEAEVAPQYLELELTEGVALEDPLGAIAIMDNLHQRGIRMSIDDFGTGYSSLSYLKRFQVYKLKIDQSFVRDITIDPDDKAIVSAVIGLASSMGKLTIAEGVETEGQLAFLREQGCDEVQGYYFSKPLPADQFEPFVRAKYSALRL